MGFASDERGAFCDALAEVAPGAPTLCAGWTAYDLAAHCWVRERSPRALLGVGIPALGFLADAAMKRAKAQHSFESLVTLLRATPVTLLTVMPGGDDLVNAVEYLVHTEDVRRANSLSSRYIEPAFEDVLWQRLALVGRLLLAKAPCGVVLERADAPASSRRVKAGMTTVTLVGAPSELVLFCFGRQRAADVHMIGEKTSVDALRTAALGA